MPTVHLTDLVARAAKSVALKQTTYWDKRLGNFGLRVGERSKTWVVMIGRNRRRVTLGRYPSMTLQDARAQARSLMQRAADARRDADVTVVSFDEACSQFVQLHLAEKKRSTATDWRRVLYRHFWPKWKTRPLLEIGRRDVSHIINQLVRESGEANNAFAVIRVFFRWCVRRGYLLESPMLALTLPVQRTPRDRVLSHAELRAVLAVIDERTAFGRIVLALVLSAQRRGEIAQLRSAWIDPQRALLTLPKEVTKNGLEHVVPLSSFLQQLLAGDGLLFRARGMPERPFNGWSKSMAKLRKASGVEFRLHDLRRTAATIMASRGTPPYVIERILNHVTASTSESITPLARIYNRHRYLDEMRTALTVLEEEVLALRRGAYEPRVDTRAQPGEYFVLDPTDPGRTELHPLREQPSLFKAIDMRR